MNDPNERQLKEHAYSVTMAVATMVEAMAMHAENQQRAVAGDSPAYNEKAFFDLLEHNGTHHNAFLDRWSRTE